MFRQKELIGQNNRILMTKSGIKPAFGDRRRNVLKSSVVVSFCNKRIKESQPFLEILPSSE